MVDVLIIERGNGGDSILRGADLAGVNGLENTGYLAMFSSNGTAWWGDYLQPEKQKYASQTEAALRTTPINSAGRVIIENAVKADISFLNDIPGTVFSVSTTIMAANRLDIEININGQQFLYQWNPDKLFLTYKVPMSQ